MLQLFAWLPALPNETDSKGEVMSARTFLAAVGFLLIAVSPLRANSKNQQSARPQAAAVSLQWEDLGPLIAGREVEIVLPDGAKLKGDVFAVRHESLVLDIKKTSDKSLYPKGQNILERASVTSLLLRKKTIRWRVIGTIAGTVLGLFAGGYVACLSDSVALGLTVMTGVPIGFHVAARPVDVLVTRIDIEPPRTAESWLQEDN
jgi:hypothetical protein